MSGATERANADTQNLFIYLYNKDPNLVVSGGRSGNALTDYNANKQIATPDWRGRALAFLDDMGNSAAGRLTASYFGTSAIVLGAAGGSESTTLTLAQLPTGITVTGAISVGAPSAAPVPYISAGSFTDVSFSPSGSGTHVPTTGGAWSSSTSLTGTANLTSNNTSGAAHRTVQPTMLATLYLKL